ncbi:FxsA family protein [Planosporangium thailandense]|uniref:FxsA family protein n=1 Tax=Planosporangium thailandense TaxID=765197 RepID=A0ABX0Y495_9ACTN|nr:FxsA family protein [Planosporangium thailandense]NJC72139.1 FxsA family protein [Planosporangium thailandense]
MRRAPMIGLAMIVTFVVEIAVFVAVAKLVGWVWAFVALLAVSAVGAWLVPRQGVRAWRRFRAAAVDGRAPGRQATDGLVGLIGALLLAVPGFVTGLAGVALLTPPLRRFARGRVERSVERLTSPALAGHLFGPRRVRVRVRRGRRATPPPPPPPPPPQQPPPAIEGEIVDDT